MTAWTATIARRRHSERTSSAPKATRRALWLTAGVLLWILASLLSFSSTARAQVEVIFSDDFESGLAAWTLTGHPDWYTGTPRNDSYSVRLAQKEALERTISTEGYESVVVSFYLGADSLDKASENVQALYYDGATWVLLKQINNGDPEEDGQLHYFEYALPPATSNNSAFRIAFQINAGGNDFGYVDGMVVRGTPVPHLLEVTAGCSPETVASGGSTSCTASYTDSRGHGVATWSWDDGGAGGSFSPSAGVQNPTYTAPENLSDSDLAVTLTVTATCDGPSPISDSDAITLTVQPVAHTLEVTAGCSPETVASGGSTNCTASYSDSRGHGVATWSWDDGGVGGSFSPSAGVQNPTYSAPQNTGDSDLAVTLTVTATCDGPSPISDSDAITLTVEPVAHTLEVTAGCSPETVASGGTASCSASYSDSRGHEIATWSWDDGGAGGSFSPSAGAQNPTYTAPEYSGEGELVVTLTVTATCDGPAPITDSDSVALTVVAELECNATFPDVQCDYWARDEIESCVAWEIVFGYPDGYYHPELSVSRAQMAVYVSRAIAGGDVNVPTGPTQATFRDVQTGYWAYKYIEYAYANSIVSGYPNGGYRPGWDVDRGQMAVFIARSIVVPLGEAGLADYVPPEEPTFPDVTTEPGDHYASCYPHVEYIAAQGIAYGYPDGGYHPEQLVSRDVMAVYIARAFELPSALPASP